MVRLRYYNFCDTEVCRLSSRFSPNTHLVPFSYIVNNISLTPPAVVDSLRALGFDDVYINALSEFLIAFRVQKRTQKAAVADEVEDDYDDEDAESEDDD